MKPKTRDRLQLFAATLLGCGIAIGLQFFRPVGEKVGETPMVESITGDADTPRRGPENAAVTITMFTDYQCPVCRKVHVAMETVLAGEPGIRLLYKDWPILGEGSERAARVALAANRQGIYPALHDRLMRRSGGLDDAALQAAVEGAGGNWARLQADLVAHGEEIDATLARNATQAYGLGLQGTPGYLVGPILVKGGLDERGFRRAIAQARD